MGINYEKMAGLLGNPHLYSTVHVCLIDAESDEVEEALYDEAAQYREDIARSMESFRTDEYPENNLMTYFKIPDDPELEAQIRKKVKTARPTVKSSGTTLYASLELELTDDLTEDEFLAFVEQIRSQYRDGWGAEFELQTIESGTDRVCLCLYHSDMEFYTANALETWAHQKEQESIPEQGARM